MFDVLLTILVIFLIFRLFSGWLIRFLVRKQSRRTRNSHYEDQPSAGKEKKKVIKKEVGEYVDFEEIKPNNPSH